MFAYDRIRLEFDDYYKIVEWYLLNENKFNEILFPLTQGVIEIRNKDTNKFNNGLIFKVNNSFCEIKQYFNFEEDWAKFEYYYKGPDEKNITIRLIDKSRDFKEICKNYETPEMVTLIYATDTLKAVLMYMALMPKEFEHDEEPTMNDNRIKRAKRHNQYNPNNQIKLTRKIYNLINPTFRNIDKKEYNRVAQSWGVRGHFRQYKSGLKIWVKPFQKGTGNLKHKNYIITA